MPLEYYADPGRLPEGAGTLGAAVVRTEEPDLAHRAALAGTPWPAGDHPWTADGLAEEGEVLSQEAKNQLAAGRLVGKPSGKP
jgi:hypothetical protein